MYKSKIELMDAIYVVKLIGVEPTFETDLGCSFPSDPMATYRSEGILYCFHFNQMTCILVIRIENNFI